MGNALPAVFSSCHFLLANLFGQLEWIMDENGRKNTPFKSIPAENDFVPAPVIIATRLPPHQHSCRRREKRDTHSSGASSYHFHRRSISQHPAIVSEFICLARLIVTSKTYGTGISRSTCCCFGGGVFVEPGVMAIMKLYCSDLAILSD